MNPKKDIGLLGSPGNTGDGIKMVQKVGAQLWHMNAQATVLGFKPAEFETGFAITLRKPGFIYVDRYGNRFLDETRLEAHEAGVATSEFDTRTYTYSHMPSMPTLTNLARRTLVLAILLMSIRSLPLMQSPCLPQAAATRDNALWLNESNRV